LLEAKLVACANIIPHVVSHFWWQGSRDQAQECIVMAKTEKNYFARVNAMITKHHSYDTPEIIALPIVAGHEPYLEWISDSVAKNTDAHGYKETD
jgi:periplasmic divalent cation tolerance protein